MLLKKPMNFEQKFKKNTNIILSQHLELLAHAFKNIMILIHLIFQMMFVN